MSPQTQMPPAMARASGHGLTPAVFLDRDGTLIEDRGDLGDPRDAVFFADTAESLRRLQRCDLPAEGTVLPGIREAADWILAWHALWQLEERNADLSVAELMPDVRLGCAVDDRLCRPAGVGSHEVC